MIFWIFIALIVALTIWAIWDEGIGAGFVAALASSLILGLIFMTISAITSTVSEDGETTRHELGVLSIDGGEESVAMVSPDGETTFAVDEKIYTVDDYSVSILGSDGGNYVDITDYEFNYWWLSPFSFGNGTGYDLYVERGSVSYGG